MRLIAIATPTVLAILTIAIWGATVITANSPNTAIAAAEASPINVMQMMKDARNLPDQQFDAY